MKTNMKNLQKTGLALLFCGFVFASSVQADEKVLASAQQLDNCVQKVEPASIVGDLAELLKVDASVVSDALVEKNFKCSDLVFAQAVAMKTGTPLAQLVEAGSKDWLACLQEAKVNLKALVQQLDDLYTEMAFRAMDKPHAKAKKGLAKK